ncbi:hypothetical protein [Pseudonocardia nigra]|uniref:hypothetical protein n=1 Tax=Pseudonocardia nigra TaxID=1921578 RepID=UPI001C5D4777|nr:hypothetical protein [Pseudonocardia nigra]
MTPERAAFRHHGRLHGLRRHRGRGGSGSGGQLWPFLLVLLAYYVNGAAFLAFSSIAERSERTRSADQGRISVRIDDGRSLSFLGGLTEGTETVLVHTLWLLLLWWHRRSRWCGPPWWG